MMVEKHPDGHVAYPVGLNGVIVGEGERYEDAMRGIKSAIQFPIESFGLEADRSICRADE